MDMKQDLLSFERLLDWLEGRLSPTEAAAVATAVQIAQADEQTQAQLAWLRRFQQAGQAARLPRPPAQVRAQLTQQFDQWHKERTAAQRPSLAGLWRAIKAELTFDSYNQPALAGVRSAPTQAAERQMVYEGYIAEIALNIYPQPTQPELTLWGQVFPLAETDLFSVQLLHNGSEKALVMTDELGEFTFPPLQPGLYDLIISGDRGDIIICDVSLNP